MTVTAIDNLGAQHAQGFVICVPDVKLGPAVVAKAKQNNLKLMTVDDRLVDGGGKPIPFPPLELYNPATHGKQAEDALEKFNEETGGIKMRKQGVV